MRAGPLRTFQRKLHCLINFTYKLHVAATIKWSANPSMITPKIEEPYMQSYKRKQIRKDTCNGSFPHIYIYIIYKYKTNNLIYYPFQV